MKRITNFDDNKLEEISANEITIEIKEINERVPALLNQELFDKLYEKGSVKTEKDLKEPPSKSPTHVFRGPSRSRTTSQ